MSVAEQAVIMAAGRGSRLQKPDPTVQLDAATERVAEQGIKALVPIGPRPFLDYSVERLAAAGIRRLVLIVSPAGDALRQYAAKLPDKFPGLAVECVTQPEPRGSAHALGFARVATGDGEFLVLNSDDIYPASALKDLAAAPRGACYAVGFDPNGLFQHSNMDSSRLSALGVLVRSPEDPERLVKVVEKPANPEEFRQNGELWVTMNIWRFSPVIYEYCAAVEKSPRGEYELPVAVNDLVESGYPVKMIRSREGVLDLTSRHDILKLRDLLGVA